MYGWFGKNLRGRKGQQGFTLIELLVVVTILGILAGIVTLSLVGLTTHSSVQACNSEYKTVQAAIDAYMANANLSALPPNTHTDVNGAQVAFTNDMTGAGTGSVALYNGSPTAQSPNYTRNGTTQFYYTWDQFGKITAIGSNAGGAGITGCVPR
jgi:prepilin-type N-terminal cleavage/methylation domain-containing protein